MDPCNQNTNKRCRENEEAKQIRRFRESLRYFLDNFKDVIPPLEGYDGSNSDIDDFPFYFKNPVKISGKNKIEISKTNIEREGTIDYMVERGFDFLFVLNVTEDLDLDDDESLDDCNLLFVSPDDFIDAKLSCDGEDDPNVLFDILTTNARELEPGHTLKDFEELKNKITEVLREQFD